MKTERESWVLRFPAENPKVGDCYVVPEFDYRGQLVPVPVLDTVKAKHFYSQETAEAYRLIFASKNLVLCKVLTLTEVTPV